MTTSVYRFSQVEAQTATAASVTQMVKTVLKADEDACYIQMERFLMPPGVSGSKSFDQAYAVATLLEHDSKQGGYLATNMEQTGMSRRMLWDRLQAALRQAHFKIQHGRLVGLLEDLRTKEEVEANGKGQPDID